jgi:serine/threonine protein kinase
VEEKDREKVIELLDCALNTAQLTTDLYRQCLRALREICGLTGTLPSTYMLAEGLTKSDAVPAASGGFADVWRGIYCDTKVGIKSLRVYRGDNQETLKQAFCREIVTWKRLVHENILPLTGVSTTLFPFCMISPWMDNGNLIDYVRSNPATNRVTLLLGVVKGLEYLHSYDIIHGDLKGANILINESKRACLADFGLTTTMSSLGILNASTLVSRRSGAVRWMAPELLDPEVFGMPSSPNLSFSTTSDVYALAMIVIELFTENKPFHEFPNEPSVIVKVINGERPTRPDKSDILGLSDQVWELVQTCWCQDSGRRPGISSVLDRLQSIIASDPAPRTRNLECNLNIKDSDSPVTRTAAASEGVVKANSDLCHSNLAHTEKHSNPSPKEKTVGFRDYRSRIEFTKWPKKLLRVLFPCMNW